MVPCLQTLLVFPARVKIRIIYCIQRWQGEFLCKKHSFDTHLKSFPQRKKSKVTNMNNIEKSSLKIARIYNTLPSTKSQFCRRSLAKLNYKILHLTKRIFWIHDPQNWFKEQVGSKVHFNQFLIQFSLGQMPITHAINKKIPIISTSCMAKFQGMKNNFT